MATYDLTSAIPNRIKAGDILNCPYSGSAKSITLPKGQYKLECWGAQGGYYPSATYTNANNNKGGYSIGTLTLLQRQNLHLYVGGAGTNITASLTAKSGGWNGGAAGGAGTSDSYGYGGAGGGGASDIRIRTDSLYARVIVAGGGGGKSPGSTVGSSSNTSTIRTSGSIDEYGGGTSGGTGHPVYNNTANAIGNFGSGNSGGGGYSNGGGSGGAGAYNQSSRSDGTYYPPGGGGGGGGWYGGGGGAGGGYNYGSSSAGQNGNAGIFGSGGTGGAGVSGYGYHAGVGGGGGGGSGYVYTSSTASNYPSGCLLNSQYYLENATTLAGNIAFASPTGANETGHTGNGYIRITVIEAKSGNTLVKIPQTLPSAYSPIEYLQFTGTQYIDTGAIVDSNTGFDITFEVLNGQSGSPYYNLFGVRGNDASGGTGETQNFFRIDTIPVDSNSGTEFKYGSTIYNSGIKNTSKINIKLLNKVYTKPDGSTITVAGTINTGLSMYIGCINKNNTAYGNKASLKIYRFKIYNGSTLTHDYIPALHISDNISGLYDIKTNTFKTDAAGGAFTNGEVINPWKEQKQMFVKTPAILPNGYTQLEYIQSSGTQYIDTGLTCNKTDDYIYTIDCELTNYENFGGANGYLQFKSNIAGGSRATIEIKYQNKVETISVNGTVNSTTDWTSTYNGTDVKIGILKLGDANNTWHSTITPQSGKVYSVKIKKAGTLIRDFYPCKNSSSTVGLYDTVNSKFYTNAGTDTFTAGEETSPWKQAKGLWTKIDSTTWKQVL